MASKKCPFCGAELDVDGTCALCGWNTHDSEADQIKGSLPKERDKCPSCGSYLSKDGICATCGYSDDVDEIAEAKNERVIKSIMEREGVSREKAERLLDGELGELEDLFESTLEMIPEDGDELSLGTSLDVLEELMDIVEPEATSEPAAKPMPVEPAPRPRPRVKGAAAPTARPPAPTRGPAPSPRARAAPRAAAPPAVPRMPSYYTFSLVAIAIGALAYALALVFALGQTGGERLFSSCSMFVSTGVILVGANVAWSARPSSTEALLEARRMAVPQRSEPPAMTGEPRPVETRQPEAAMRKETPPAEEERFMCPVCEAVVGVSTSKCPTCGAEFDD